MPQEQGGAPITVEVEGLGTVEFPAGTDEATMKRAIDTQLAQSHVQQGQAVPHPIVQRMLSWLPAIGGAAGGVLGGLAGVPEGGVGAIPGAIGGAALGGAAGESLRQNVNRIVGNPAPTTAGQAAGAIGGQAVTQGAAEAAGAGIGKAASALAPRLMQSAVKPTLSVLKDYRTTAPRLVKTLLDEGINVTNAGLAKLHTLLDATNKEIADAVSNRAALMDRAGTPIAIPKSRVAAQALTTAKKFSNQANPTADLRAVGDTVEEFLDHPIFKGDLTLPEAQAMKIGTYQQVGKKYGQVAPAAIETQKALARGLKEEIAAEVPGIQALNARDSALMASVDAIQRRVAQAGNQNPVGFAWVAAHPTTFLAALLDRSPAVKSMVARGLYSSAGLAAKVSPQLIRVAVASLASSPDLPETSDAPDGGPPRQ